MSMPNTPIKCTQCDFTGYLVHRPITLIYQLPNGEQLIEGRQFGWCKVCDGIRDIEPNFIKYFDTENRITELSEKVASVGHKLSSALSSIIGMAARDDENELRTLTLGLKIARARNSSPRCLTCGTAGAGAVTALEEYTHICGGHLIPLSRSDDAPRFSYSEETIYLDYEGNRVGQLTPLETFTNLAQKVDIEGVLDKGLVSGILVFTLFDKADLLLMKNEPEIYRKFANMIELRIMHGDFENPFSESISARRAMGLSGELTKEEESSLADSPRVLFDRTKVPVAKWLRSEIRDSATSDCSQL